MWGLSESERKSLIDLQYEYNKTRLKEISKIYGQQCITFSKNGKHFMIFLEKGFDLTVDNICDIWVLDMNKDEVKDDPTTPRQS